MGHSESIPLLFVLSKIQSERGSQLFLLLKVCNPIKIIDKINTTGILRDERIK